MFNMFLLWLLNVDISSRFTSIKREIFANIIIPLNLFYLYLAKLDQKYKLRVLEHEKNVEETLKERQQLCNIAFQEDMKLYKESGILPTTKSTWFLFHKFIWYFTALCRIITFLIKMSLKVHI